MSLPFLNTIAHRQKLFFCKKKTAGFTLIELLIVTVLGSMVVSGLLWVMSDILRENQRELALSSTQQDMKRALAFMEEDLREAVYTYDGTGLSSILPYLPSSFTATGTVPILAFWKVEPVPYSTSDSLPDCTTPPISSNQATKDECDALKIERRSYTLVVYLLSTTDTNPKTWQGRSRITRYQLRKYGTLSTLAHNPGYADPRRDSTFATWPKDINNNTAQASGTISSTTTPLVDFVALPNDSNINVQLNDQDCPADEDKDGDGKPEYEYKRTPDSQSKSFFACVGTNKKNTANQDVLIFLTGNARGNAGLDREDLIAPLKTQVINRGVIEKLVQE